jgi:hypothetical protein
MNWSYITLKFWQHKGTCLVVFTDTPQKSNIQGRNSGSKDAELGAKICFFKSTFIFPTVLKSFRADRSHGTFGFLRCAIFQKR